MATPKSQRVGIWVIAIVMLVGTIGSFAAMIVGSQNDKSDQDKYNQQLAEMQKQQQEQQKKDQERADQLTGQYYPQFAPYKTSPATFDAEKVGDKVTTNDLKTGDGAEIKSDTIYEAYYIGWNPKGKTFDSSFDEGEKLKVPISNEGGLIKGWSEGVVGMKVGGVREITIPSDLAYGEAGAGDDIPPNTPLKFIVMIVAVK